MAQTKKMTLVALLASLYTLLSFLPGFPMLGVPGSKIDLTRSFEMLYGFLLGPIVGPSTSFLGAIVGKTLQGGGSGLFFTPLAIVSSFMGAVLVRHKVFNVKGWLLAAILLGVMILGWYSTSTGSSIGYYPIIHLASLAVILIFRGRIADYYNSENKRKLTFGVALASLPSTMAGHMAGNLIFIMLFSPDPLFFASILPISIIERTVLTLISTIVSVPIIILIRSLYPELVKDTNSN